MNELGVDVPVGDPVDEVEGDEDRGREPHGPGVDIVAERLLVGAHSPLHLPNGQLGETQQKKKDINHECPQRICDKK